MKTLCLLFYCCFLTIIISLPQHVFSQNVGIGTTSPDAKAALDIKATDKGVLFPRLSIAQRDAIANPPNGLHIFNTDERCLNYYDSVYAIWNCYCESCQTAVITISNNICRADFYSLYAKGSPAKKYIITILAGDTISGCNPGDTALSFNSMPFDATVTINNYGVIEGAGGNGGAGSLGSGCGIPYAFSGSGGPGGYAISTKPGVSIIINNYGIVAGGGGGGAGSGGNPNGYGGGGGGGAGIIGGIGGLGGGAYTGIFGFCGPQIIAAGGAGGTAIAGGNGGLGNSGGVAGGAGGGRGQAGQNGSGVLDIVGTGGAPGKAIGGGSGNKLNNIGSGQSFGTVD